jgi:hypothetical protein
MVDEGARRRKIDTGGGERGLILVQGAALSALWLSACFARTRKQPAIPPAAFVRLRSIERREWAARPEYCLCRGG